MTLYRHALGYVIRAERLKRGMNMRDVSTQAPMALGYLSEVERGQKELSSEFLVLIARALDIRVSDLTYKVADVMLDWEQQHLEELEVRELLLAK